ncbi:MAG: hypothetical protein ABWZ66_11405 [Pyrinomonadaceae bacterium]
MRIKAILLWLVLFTVGCPSVSDLSAPKSVEIEGLGSLPAISQKPLNETDLTKVVETVNKQKRINEPDARAMLEIYRREIKYFVEASAFSEKTENLLEKHDVEACLALILQHENLREEARKITQERIIEALSGWIRFDENDKTGMSGAAAALSAAYHNAFNQSAAKDNEELKNQNYSTTHAANNAAVVAAFERSAHEFIEGRKEPSGEQKENAVRFVEALKIYNDSLPAGEKILDGGGRLVSPVEMSAVQRARAGDIFGKPSKPDSDSRATPLDKAVNLLNDRMKPTFSEMRDETNAQIRR